MQVLLKAEYAAEMLLRLNRVQMSLPLLFMLDVLTASGNMVNTEILLRRPRGETCSNMRWPQERPTNSDLQSWKNAILTTCLSGCKSFSIGGFPGNTHRIWHWLWCEEDFTLRLLHKDKKTEEAFISGHKPNRFHYSHSQPHSRQRVVCSVHSTLDGGHWRLLSTTPRADPPLSPLTFLDVLQTWENTWLWENMTVTGGLMWISKSITNSTLVVVTDGSYIRELFPNLCSAAFVFECSAGCGRIVGSFSELLLVANAYRGELLGLKAIHLILLSVNKLHCNLAGSVEIVSGCLGALKRVTYLPPYRTPS